MEKKAHFAGVLIAFIFGLSFMFSKIALDHVIPIGLIAYRFLVAFLGFELIRLSGIVKIKLQKNVLYPLMIVSLFQPILYFLFETYGLRMTTSGEAGMMIALIPIFVAIFSALLLKEKPKKAQIFFIMLSVSGIVFIQVAKGLDLASSDFWGFVLLFMAVISAALFNIASRSASKKLKPYEITYFMMLSGAVVFNLMYIVQLAIEKRPLDYILNLGHLELVLPLLYLGIIASIGGFFLVNFALGILPAHVSSIYANLSTIVAIAAGAIVLHETLEYYHYVGGAMIIVGVYGTVSLNRVYTKKKLKI
ncbi:MAG: DMT family transporter [Bacilli bacterium]|nr:DMT family transporter [Bacilli bacterium]